MVSLGSLNFSVEIRITQPPLYSYIQQSDLISSETRVRSNQGINTIKSSTTTDFP